ncbi:alpha-glucosidase [Lactovum miscens]|uniref:Glucan 1,6-alpha-glucosidase n=1 Tax=Lactovum miscens TaxID=190387 RepID=A0A841C351_9LACT|nr:alpha-glucosidase [Lactovum miscens]MBB5888386.1 alpha-glucosidase [Lactovum miscens]
MKNDKNYFHRFVGYQIYPKSFRDSNGDGVGDVLGIIEKLPYLKKLGVDFLWLNPIYKSPQIDGGYDISDYFAIDEMFGNLDELKRLFKEAHKLNFKIIMDLVVNHTSDQHPWFLASKKSKDNPYRNFYLWEDATANQMPNDWISFFGGSTWTFDKTTNQAYFHVFAKEQPDLNWKNPELRAEIYKMIRWWLELGLDGFRLDAISHIQKKSWDFKIKSWRANGPWQPFMNVTGIEDYMKELKDIFNEYGALTVGEASGVLSSDAPNWTDENGYIDMIFELEQNVRRPDGSGDIYKFKQALIRWQKAQLERGWNALYLDNHDQPRSIDIFGDGSEISGKALAVAYMLLRGTPFIYQGQEIGMTNFPFESFTQLRTIENIRHYKDLLKDLPETEALKNVTINARDHARTPMQWDKTENSGFSKNMPWMEVNPNYETINVVENTSIFKLYQWLIKLRHDEFSISDGLIKFYFEKHRTAFVYERNDFLILTNLGKTKANLKFDFKIEGKNYQQILGSKKCELSSKMTLEGWEYQVFKKISQEENGNETN